MNNYIQLATMEPINIFNSEFTDFPSYKIIKIEVDSSHPHYIEAIEAMNNYLCETAREAKILVASPNFYKNLWAEMVHGNLSPLPLEIAVAPNNGEINDFFVCGDPKTDLMTIINREQSFSREEE